jgi:hypothetical protein
MAGAMPMTLTQLNRLIALFAVVFISSSCQTTSPEPNVTIDAALWRADLEFVRVNLPKRHISAFHAVSQEAFDAGIDRLESLSSNQSADARLVGLFQVLNLIGDGHTSLIFPRDRAYFPIEIQEFGSEFRVARSAPGFEQALGAHVVRINGMAVGEAMERALELTPSDENVWNRARLSQWIGSSIRRIACTPVWYSCNRGLWMPLSRFARNHVGWPSTLRLLLRAASCERRLRTA